VKHVLSKNQIWPLFSKNYSQPASIQIFNLGTLFKKISEVREQMFFFFSLILGIFDVSVALCIHLIEKTLSGEKHKPLTMGPNGFLGRCIFSFAYSKYKPVPLWLIWSQRVARGNGNRASLPESGQIVHLTVVCLVTWPLNGSEAGVDLALIKTLLLFTCKSCCSHALPSTQRPGH